MPWAGAGEALDALSVELKRAGAGDLPAYAAGVVARRLVTAQEEIRALLRGRGFSEAQLVSWPGLVDVHRDQTLWWCMVDLRQAFKDAPGATQGAVGPTTDKLNRLAWLAQAPLYDGAGAPIVPAGAFEGGVGSGNFTDRENFNARRAAERRWRGDWCGDGVLGGRR